MKKRDQKLLTVIVTGFLLAVLILAGNEETVPADGAVDAGGAATGGHRYRVVIDAGHGGIDPGKIGINGAEEKDINLRIAARVRDYLRTQDVEVIMTREGDDGLYDAGADNKKVQDMKRRIEIIDGSVPSLAVSIHQNSYPEEYVKGAQVFYYTGSRQSQKLAESIQKSMVKRLDPENHRQVKANDSYYLLKKTNVPIVIAECGFLANSAEAALLCDEDYQDKTAWAICMGIMQYLNDAD